MELFENMEDYWALTTSIAVTAVFPFSSKFKADWIHFDEQSAKVANILAGIGAAAILLRLVLERHRAHELMSFLPGWFLLTTLGIGLFILHFMLILQKPTLVGLPEYKKDPRYNGARGLALILYVGGYVFLALGFNLPFIHNVGFIPVTGTVACKDAGLVILAEAGAARVLATSPVVDGRYQFLLTAKEKSAGKQLEVRLETGSIDPEKQLVDLDEKPNLALNFDCTRV